MHELNENVFKNDVNTRDSGVRVQTLFRLEIPLQIGAGRHQFALGGIGKGLLNM